MSSKRGILPFLLLAFAMLLPAAVVAAGVAEGDKAPAVALPAIPTGEEISLASLQGKVVYLDFWASWCGPCRVSFPQLQSIREDLVDQGFEVYAISVDEELDDALAFLRDVPVTYPVLHDAQGVTPQQFGILGMPYGYLIDRSGTVRHIHQGYKKSDGAKLRAMITELLGE